MSILKLLQNDPKWKPTPGLWFRKYVYKIEIGPYPSNHQYVSVEKPDRQKVSYRHDPETNDYVIYNSIYTSNIDTLLAFVNNTDYRAIYTPHNEEHETMLRDNKDNKIVIRDSLYYKKYRYKIEVSRNWREWNRSDTDNLMKDCAAWCVDAFDNKDTMLRQTSGYYSDIPFIYTNDIKPVMLLKLAYSDRLIISVSEVRTHDELKG